MKVHELLQIELWSKRTSWKICIGIGIVVVFAVVGLNAFFAVERYWLTPGERRAARTALAQIDGLQNLDSISDQDFSAKTKLVQQSVDLAHDAAWTIRDKQIVAELMRYSLATVIDRRSIRMRMSVQHQLDEKLNSSGIKLYGMELHKALD
jgi:hypothetical protein